MVIHLVESVEVFFDHEEVERALEAELAQRTLEFVYLGEDALLKVLVELDAGSLHEG